MDNLDSRVKLFVSLPSATPKPISQSHFCITCYKSASFYLELLVSLLAVIPDVVSSYSYAEKKNVLSRGRMASGDLLLHTHTHAHTHGQL